MQENVIVNVLGIDGTGLHRYRKSGPFLTLFYTLVISVLYIYFLQVSTGQDQKAVPVQISSPEEGVSGHKT